MQQHSEMVTVLIMLPIFYNPDRLGRRRAIEEEKFDRTAKEIAMKFGGGFLHRFRPGEARGFWWDNGVLDKDDLVVLEVDLPNTRTNRNWLKSYAKDVIIGRFRQKAIYMKFVSGVKPLLVRDESVE